MKIGIVCVSDRCSQGVYEDKSGPAISEMINSIADEIIYRIVPDEETEISETLIDLSDNQKADVVLTTGGTGFAPRDVTPEATEAVIQRRTPGISEAIRQRSLCITPNAMLSRATSGIRGKTLIINLPGSPKAVRESLEVIIPVLKHAVETMSGVTQSCGGNYNK